MLRKILAFTILAPALLACAPFAPTDLQSMTPQQLSLVDTTCTQVMGLRAGEYYFAQCRETLAHALAAKIEDQDMGAAYGDCRWRGLAEGTAAFSTCMLDSKATASPAEAVPANFAGNAGVDSGKSFYHMTPREAFQHERYSCAQLGLLPGGGAFGQCVANLQIAMMANTN